MLTTESHSTTSQNEPLAVSMREAAFLCSLSERTIWSAIQDGRLKAAKIGRSVRITRDALHEFLNAQQG